MAKVEIRIGAVLTELDQKLREAKGKLEEFSGWVQKHSSQIKKVRLQAGVALAGEILAIRDLVKAYREQEQADAKLTQAMKNRGIFTAALLKDYKAFAAEMQRVTRFGDEAVQSVMTQLTAFGMQGDALKNLTRATLDFAEAQGMDVVSAGELFAKSIGSTLNALARYGVQIQEGITDPTERAIAITESISKLFGGQAAASANTMTGALDQLSNIIGDLKEDLGAALMPMIRDLAKWLKDAIPPIQQFVQENQTLISILAGAGVGGTGLVLLLSQFALAFSNPVTGIIAVIGLAAVGIAALVAHFRDLAKVHYEMPTSVEGITAKMTELENELRATRRELNELTAVEMELGDLATATKVDTLTKKIENYRKALEELGRAKNKMILAAAAQGGAPGAGAMEGAGGVVLPGEPAELTTGLEPMLAGVGMQLETINEENVEMLNAGYDEMIAATESFASNLAMIWEGAFAALGDIEAKGLAVLMVGLIGGLIGTLKLVIQSSIHEVIAERIKEMTKAGMRGILDPSNLFKIALIGAAAGAGIAALNALQSKATASLAGSVKRFRYGGVLDKTGLYHGEAGEVFFNPEHPVDSLRNMRGAGGVNFTFQHYGDLRSRDDVEAAVRRFEETLYYRRLTNRLG